MFILPCRSQHRGLFWQIDRWKSRQTYSISHENLKLHLERHYYCVPFLAFHCTSKILKPGTIEYYLLPTSAMSFSSGASRDGPLVWSYNGHQTSIWQQSSDSVTEISVVADTVGNYWLTHIQTLLSTPKPASTLNQLFISHFLVIRGYIAARMASQYRVATVRLHFKLGNAYTTWSNLELSNLTLPFPRKSKHDSAVMTGLYAEIECVQTGRVHSSTSGTEASQTRITHFFLHNFKIKAKANMVKVVSFICTQQLS